MTYVAIHHEDVIEPSSLPSLSLSLLSSVSFSRDIRRRRRLRQQSL